MMEDTANTAAEEQELIDVLIAISVVARRLRCFDKFSPSHHDWGFFSACSSSLLRRCPVALRHCVLQYSLFVLVLSVRKNISRLQFGFAQRLYIFIPGFI